MPVTKSHSDVRKALAVFLVVIVAVGFGYYIQTTFAETSFVTIAMSVTYTDGTSSPLYNPSNKLQPQSVVDVSAGKTVATTSFYLVALPTFSSTVANYTISAAITTELRSAANVLLKNLTSTPITKTGTSLVNGSLLSVYSDQKSGSDIEALYNFVADQQYYYVVRLTAFNMSLTFTDGQSAFKTATALDLNWKIQYKSNAQFLSLSVNWTQTVT